MKNRDFPAKIGCIFWVFPGQFSKSFISGQVLYFDKQNFITRSKLFAKPKNAQKEEQESKASNFKIVYFFILIIYKT